MRALPDRTALHRAVTNRAAIDARALAALRIALGSILLLDLALRARSLVAFYTDDGIVTRAVLAELYPAHSYLSIHALSGDAWWQVLLFAVAGGAAVALVVGYRTRLATVVSLLLLLSLQARNPTVLNSGDVLFRRLLFWAVFLPIGCRWSVDAVGSARGPRRVVNLATVALLLQVVLVYATNAIWKAGSERWFAGEAIRGVLSLERYGIFLASFVTEYPRLLAAVTWAWLALVLASPLLLLTAGRIRWILAGAFLCAHLGMAMTMDLGIFPLVSMAALLPFFPPSVWDRLERVRPSAAVPRWSVATDDERDHKRPSSTVSTDVGRSRRALHATLLVVLVLSNAVGIGLLAAPEGTPEEITDGSWRMFARPPSTDAWTVADGSLVDGGRIDALRGSPVRQDRPPDVTRFPNARWRKHLSRYAPGSALTPALADYLCRQWDGSGRPALENVTIRRAYASLDREEASVSDVGHFRCGENGAIDGSRRAEG